MRNKYGGGLARQGRNLIELSFILWSLKGSNNVKNASKRGSAFCRRRQKPNGKNVVNSREKGKERLCSRFGGGFFGKGKHVDLLIGLKPDLLGIPGITDTDVNLNGD